MPPDNEGANHWKSGSWYSNRGKTIFNQTRRVKTSRVPYKLCKNGIWKDALNIVHATLMRKAEK